MCKDQQRISVRRMALSLVVGIASLMLSWNAAFAFYLTPEERCNDPRVKYAVKEGELLVLTSIFETPETQNAHREAFMKHWCLPQSFEVKYEIRNAPSVIALIEAEVAAGRQIAGDVTTMPEIPWLMKARDNGLLMAYDSQENPYMELPEKIGLNDRPYWTSDMYMFVPMWNSSCPGFEDLKIESWLDLLDPKLKDQMTIGDGLQEISLAVGYYFLKDRLPADYWKKLAAQNLLIVSTSLQGIEMLTSCERPLYAMGISADANVLWSQGETWIRTALPKEGVMLQEQATAIFADAPHPNAAQLWVDFLRSAEGQALFEKFEGRIPGRKGVPSSTPETTPNADNLFEVAFAPDYTKMVQDPELVRRAQEEWGSIFVK